MADSEAANLEQTIDLAAEHHQAGRLDAAEALYRRWTGRVIKDVA